MTFVCPEGQVFDHDWFATPFILMTCQDDGSFDQPDWDIYNCVLGGNIGNSLIDKAKCPYNSMKCSMRANQNEEWFFVGIKNDLQVVPES